MKKMKENLFNVVAGSVIGTCGYFFGGWDVLLEVLLVAIVIDYLTGLYKAYDTKTLSSKFGFRGIFKKVIILAVVVFSVELERLLGAQIPIREVTIGFYIANEGISILENIAPYAPIPQVITDALLQFKGKSNKSDETQ